MDWWQLRNLYMPKAKLPEIRAIDVLAQIRLGERVEHDRVSITGDLGPLLSEIFEIKVGQTTLQLNYCAKSPIIITNSLIQGKVTFEEILFCETVDFRGTTFEKEVSFMGSIFRQQCIFEGAHFKEATHFSDLKRCKPEEDRHAHFIGQSNFKKTTFEKYVDFSKVEFEQSAEFSSSIPGESADSKSLFKGNENHFESAQFKKIAHFEECEFENRTYFSGAHFEREAYFNGAVFGSYTNFRLINFNDNTYFNNATFSGGVSFAESIFKGNGDFRRATFNGEDGNFRKTKFSGEFVSFRNAKFRNLCDQAVVCKKARKQLEDSGSRNEADHNFFMEMEAKRRQKGITEVKGEVSRLALNPELKIFSEFIEDFRKECLPWNDRLSIMIQLIDYHLMGSKNLTKKFLSNLNEKGLSWGKRLSIIFRFLWHNLVEVIIFRHLFGGYGIFWQWIFFWWLFFCNCIWIDLSLLFQRNRRCELPLAMHILQYPSLIYERIG